MLNFDHQVFRSATEAFHRAQRKALWKVTIASFFGKPAGLLCLDDLPWPTIPGKSRRLQDIPLDAIIGSVGRCCDFTRDFLPKHSSSKERWVRILHLVHENVGLPPIEVIRVGEVYFVMDGHHRVSVVRHLGHKTIEAYVTELKPLKLDPAHLDPMTRRETPNALASGPIA